MLGAQQFEYGVAALHGAIGLTTRIVAFGRLRQRGQQRGFRKIQFAHVLAEVALRCRLDTVGAIAEINLVQVQLENFLLRVFAFDRQRHFRLAQLADDRLGAFEPLGEDVPRELHGDGREALREPAADHVDGHRAEDADEVDTVMTVKAFVLGEDERILHQRRKVLQSRDGAALKSELGEESTVGRVEFGGLARLVEFEHVDAGALSAGADERPAANKCAESERHAEGAEQEGCPDEAIAEEVGRCHFRKGSDPFEGRPTRW